MNREEAIKWLQQIENTYIHGGDEAFDESRKEALHMAIEALEGVCFDEWCTDCKEYDTEKKCCPRFNKVIRGAMKRETHEDGTQGDLISRAEAIYEIHDFFFKVTDELPRVVDEDGDEVIADVESMTELLALNKELCERINALQSADRPRGEWIETAQDYYETVNKKGGGVNENTEYFIDDIACSECLTKFSNIDNETERFNFCPNCGADMRGDTE